MKQIELRRKIDADNQKVRQQLFNIGAIQAHPHKSMIGQVPRQVPMARMCGINGKGPEDFNLHNPLNQG